MRILVSAYACEPNKGSEPEVGWRWMIKLSGEYDELVIVTRSNNQENVEGEFSKLNIKNVTLLNSIMFGASLKFKFSREL